MKLFLLLTIFTTSCFAKSYDDVVLRFFGFGYSDYKNLTIGGSFSTIGSGYFSPTKKTVMFIHGRDENYDSDVMKELHSSFFFSPRILDYNIVMADWGTHSNESYISIMLNVKTIGQKFVDLLNIVKASGYDIKKFYPVGFGVGAHIAGRIGTILKGQGDLLPRITGLDPSGGVYSVGAAMVKIIGDKSNKGPFRVLNKGDAAFVDIIHTNAHVDRGISFPTGDLDFWPNGGMRQPHCWNCGLFKLYTKSDCSICSHDAAYKYYAESARSLLPNFPSTGCKKNAIASKSSCSQSNTANMGYWASSSSVHGSYWLETNAIGFYSKLF